MIDAPRYVYTGSRIAEQLACHFDGVEQRRGHLCDPVRRADGRVVRCTQAGTANALIRFEDGTPSTVSPRRLRLVEKLPRTYLTACSKSKRPHCHQARVLYTGDLFEKTRAWAERDHRPGDRWFILSAKWWLLHPSRLTAPYDETLNDFTAQERRDWSSETARQLLSVTPRRTHFIILAGKKYREHLVPRLQAEGHPCSVPLAGLGIGQQKAWLKDRIGD